MNHILYKDFLDKQTQQEIIDYVDTINENFVLNDHHLKYLISKMNGKSYMYDLSKTDLTSKMTLFQSGGYVMKDELPNVFHILLNEIADKLALPTDHTFLQIVDMNQGGIIGKHYDSSFSGFINYKCNISILSEEYDFCIDNEIVKVNETDMYCFEASLYKHWTAKPYAARRILLSFGFLVPYEVLGRDWEEPRVRLSRRIEKYFQN